MRRQSPSSQESEATLCEEICESGSSVRSRKKEKGEGGRVNDKDSAMTALSCLISGGGLRSGTPKLTLH
jgi:hypothetical protein